MRRLNSRCSEKNVREKIQYILTNSFVVVQRSSVQHSGCALGSTSSEETFDGRQHI